MVNSDNSQNQSVFTCLYLQIRSITHSLINLFLRKLQFTHVCEQNYSFHKIENKKFDLQLYFSMKRGNTGKRI